MRSDMINDKFNKKFQKLSGKNVLSFGQNKNKV